MTEDEVVEEEVGDSMAELVDDEEEEEEDAAEAAERYIVYKLVNKAAVCGLFARRVHNECDDGKTVCMIFL